MIDVIFKQNYFEELPDDIKDKILKKTKEMNDWDIINKGTNNLYKKLKKYLIKAIGFFILQHEK